MFDFFNWLSNLKKLVIPNGAKNMQNVIQMASKFSYFLPKQSQKIAQRRPPDPRLQYVGLN